jgi:hypothetical protein
MDKPGGAARRKMRYYPEIMLREKLKSWKSTAVDSFAGELTDFVALCEGKDSPRIADGHAGVRAVEVATAVAESTRTSQAVTLSDLGPMRRGE